MERGADMNTHISQRSLEAAKPPASGYRILFDDKIAGFGIRVTAAGTKLFVLNYRVGGQNAATPWDVAGMDGGRGARRSHL
jgi:hypothetical protein